ncbi:MAG: AI-2E family transporter [Desulfobulbus sp.]|nr:AI-2E family transporter [Desulfobulbus sp.]
MALAPPTIQRVTFLLIFSFASLMLGVVLWPFWTQLFLAFLLATVFHPAYLRMTTRIRPWMAASLTCLLITLCVFLPLLFSIGALSAEIPGVIQLAKKNDLLVLLQQTLENNVLVHRVTDFLAGFGIHFDIDKLPEMITKFSTTVGLFLYNQVSGLAADIISFIFQFCIVITGVFFLLIEFDRLTNYLLRLSPLPESQNRFLIDRFSSISGAILVGNTLSGLIQGVCGCIYFAVMGYISPVLWGAVMAVMAFMPIVGIGLIFLPTAVILYLKGYGWQALFAVIFYLLLSFSIDYLFKPRFVGNQAQLPPLLVLLSIIGGVSMCGLMGIIYGPLALTAFLTLSDMYFREYQPYFEPH